jgi:hypothetical protein
MSKPRIEIYEYCGWSGDLKYWWRLLIDNKVIAVDPYHHKSKQGALCAAHRAKRLMAEAEIEEAGSK